MLCTLCPRACAVDRAAGELGFCGMPEQAVVARAALHNGEEPALGGEQGAGAIFFAGCSLRCVYCQNYDLSRGRSGVPVSNERLAEIFRELEEQGAKCIDLVTPTHFAPAVRAALTLYRPHVPVVWNSSGYETVETLRSMEGLIDIYLPDLKYWSSDTAARYSAAPDYFRYAAKALREMARQTGTPVVDETGLMKRGMIVRHLVLPGAVAETRKLLIWLHRVLPDAYLSLMAQYTPFGESCSYPPLDRMLTEEEYAGAAAIVEELGFENGYLQETDSSGVTEIPIFDGTGVLRKE